jgi:hypothetical protein
MKKLITLFFAVLAVAAVNAQTVQDKVRRAQAGTATSTTVAGEQGRQAEIDQINREYDAKIANIRNSSLPQSKKDDLIRRQEAERARRIDEVNRRYSNTSGSSGNGSTSGGTSTSPSTEVKEKYKVKSKTKHKHDDDDDDDKVDGGKDNGKHLGWEKGVGNPHKNGGKPGKKKKG